MSRLKLIVLLATLAGLAACNADKKVNGDNATEGQKKNKLGKYPQSEKVFFPSGELQMAGKMTKGKRNGPWSSWFKNGQQNSEASFVNDKMHGPYTVWYENGNVRIQGHYEMDKEIGIWYFFHENGDTAKVVNFDSLKTK